MMIMRSYFLVHQTMSSLAMIYQFSLYEQFANWPGSYDESITLHELTQMTLLSFKNSFKTNMAAT